MHCVFNTDYDEELTEIDKFNMNLCATLNYQSVSVMLEMLDIFEYKKWLQMYKKTAFGPSITNQQFGLLTWVTSAIFGNTKTKLDAFQIGETGEIKNTQKEDVAARLMRSMRIEQLTKEGTNHQEAAKKANEEASQYKKRLLHKRLTEDMNAVD